MHLTCSSRLAVKGQLHEVMVNLLSSNEDDDRDMIVDEARVNNARLPAHIPEAQEAITFFLPDPTGLIFGTPEAPRTGFIAVHMYEDDRENEKHDVPVLTIHFVMGHTDNHAPGKSFTEGLQLTAGIAATRDLEEGGQPVEPAEIAQEICSAVYNYLARGVKVGSESELLAVKEETHAI